MVFITWELPNIFFFMFMLYRPHTRLDPLLDSCHFFPDHDASSIKCPTIHHLDHLSHICTSFLSKLRLTSITPICGGPLRAHKFPVTSCHMPAPLQISSKCKCHQIFLDTVLKIIFSTNNPESKCVTCSRTENTRKTPKNTQKNAIKW